MFSPDLKKNIKNKIFSSENKIKWFIIPKQTSLCAGLLSCLDTIFLGNKQLYTCRDALNKQRKLTTVNLPLLPLQSTRIKLTTANMPLLPLHLYTSPLREINNCK